MNKKVKKLWLEALRSGRFPKGRNYLRCEVDGRFEYCCLGVLCEVAIENDLPGKPERKNPSESVAYNSTNMYLPAKLAVESGVSIKHQKALAGLNDWGDDFTEVIDYIEKTL